MPTAQHLPRRLIILIVAWSLVAIAHLCAVWLFNLWLLGAVLFVGAWLVAVTVTVTVSLALWRGRRRWAIGALAGSVLAAAVIVVAPWTELFARSYFWANRADFATVERLARTGQFASDEYYGVALPTSLAHLSVMGKAATIGTVSGGGSEAVFLAQSTGIPDGAVGFGFVTSSPVGQTYDCFGDGCRAAVDLGGGWHWFA